MWFKSAQIFTVDLSDAHLKVFKDETLLEEKIAARPFRPCQAQEISTIGFAPLFGRAAPAYTFTDNGCHFLRLVEETKLLPASVIKSELEAQVEEKETQLGRELRKNEIQTLKTALVNQLLSRAFAAQRDMYVMINSEKGYAMVSVSSAKRAERAIAMLREAFDGTFPARHFQPRCVVEERMTAWLSQNDLPQVFTLGYDTTLKSSDEEGGTIRASREDLTSEEIAVHINAGKVITELQLTYEDSLSLVLTADLALKRMRPEDQYLERNLPEKVEDHLADEQAQYILQAALFTSLIDSLKGLFDCE